MISRWGSVISILSVSVLAFAIPTQNPQQLAYKVWLATSGSRSADLATIELHGTALSHVGGNEKSGTIVLKAQGATKSRVDLSLDGVQTSEISDSAGSSNNVFKDQQGKVHQFAVHNTWTPAAWFFPALLPTALWNSTSELFTSPAAANTTALTLQSSAQPNKVGKRMHDLVGRLSVVQYLIDPNSYLPTAITFNTHPDNDLNTNIAVEVQYSDYRNVDGVQVPFRIRKYLNGDLILDITVSDATINPVFSASEFQAN